MMSADGSNYFYNGNSFSLNELVAHATSGNPAALEHHIANRANIDAKDEDGMALIHYAACHGNVQLIHALWRNAADLNLRDNGSPAWKPVHYAIFHRQHEAEQSLIALGATPPLPILKQVILQKPVGFQPGQAPSAVSAGAFGLKS